MTADVNALRADFVHRVDPDNAFEPQWRAALQEVPRQQFVPAFFVSLTDRPGWRIVACPSDEWIEGVLSNRPLITQLNGTDDLDEVLNGRKPGWSTSSSSQPSLMVQMLQALGIREGHQVLEIGTGSGYNAGLLCHRLGSDAVTTVDIDPTVTDRARTRLAQLGYHPEVCTDDGLKGSPARSPFDRIMATVATDHLPQTWIAQTRESGKILFPLDTRNCGGLIPLLTVHGDTAEGHFLPEFGGFMPLRQQTRHDGAQAAFLAASGDDDERRSTVLDHEVVTDDGSPFEFFAALFTGGYDQMSFIPSNGDPTETWIALADGSWTCHITDSDGTHYVRQGGPKKLWDRLEHLHATWIGLGEPTRERFGLTVTRSSHTIWLDHPVDGPHWQLPEL